MYNDEWKPVMTADSMETKINEFAQLAEERAESQEKDINDIVHSLTHDAYLSKHTTSDVLSELAELEAMYPDAFYMGEANDHIMSYLNDGFDTEFWFDYAYISLAAGLEWAILNRLKEENHV